MWPETFKETIAEKEDTHKKWLKRGCFFPEWTVFRQSVDQWWWSKQNKKRMTCRQWTNFQFACLFFRHDWTRSNPSGLWLWAYKTNKCHINTSRPSNEQVCQMPKKPDYFEYLDWWLFFESQTPEYLVLFSTPWKLKMDIFMIRTPLLCRLL